MKGIQLRDSARKLKANNIQSKNAQSQSPTHKKLLKKVEMVHKDQNNKNDMSLKENLILREPQEEVAVDFRVEIERRFARSNHNQNFKFPLHHDDEDSGDSSNNSSFSSLTHVTTYDLASQNKKLLIQQLKNAFKPSAPAKKKEAKPKVETLKQNYVGSSTNKEMSDWDREEASGVPIEVRIRDKNSVTYQKLLLLIERQINPDYQEQDDEDQEQNVPVTVTGPVVVAQMARPQQNEQEQKSKVITGNGFKGVLNTDYSGILNTVEDYSDLDAHKVDAKKKKDRTVKSQGRYDKTQYGATASGESLRGTKFANISTGVYLSKKTLASEKSLSRLVTVVSPGTTSFMDKPLVLNSSTTKAESSSKGFTDGNRSLTKENSSKKLYANSILKSMTPQLIKNAQYSNVKENYLRSTTHDTYTDTNPNSTTKSTIDSLYQKAKTEVINNSKLKTSSNTSSTSYLVKNPTYPRAVTKREETPKDNTKKVNLNHLYGSNDSHMSSSQGLDKSLKVLGYASSNNLTKKESLKAFQIPAPYKKTSESPMYASYDYNSASKLPKKPSFKLDLNKKSQPNRESVSSTRNRNKKTPDRAGEILNTDSSMRATNTYDMSQQYSYMLNNSATQKSASRKNIGFMASTNPAGKNLTFTKNYYSFK